MNKIIALVLLLSLSYTHLKAQEVTVNKSLKEVNGISYTEYSILLPTKDIKKVQNDWSKHLKFEGMATDVNVSENQVYTGVSASNKVYFINPLHIISNIGFTEQGLVVYAHFMRVSDSTFVDNNINEDKNVRLKNFLRKFEATQQEVIAAQKLLGEKEDLSRLQDELKAFEKEEKKQYARIKKLERKTLKIDKKISNLQREQDIIQQEIDKQKQRVLETATLTKTEQKASRKVLKDIEKQYRKVQKDIDHELKEKSQIEYEIQGIRQNIESKSSGKALLLDKIEKQQNKLIKAK